MFAVRAGGLSGVRTVCIRHFRSKCRLATSTPCLASSPFSKRGPCPIIVGGGGGGVVVIVLSCRLCVFAPRYVMQLRQPSSGSFLLLGTEDPLVYEEWVEDILYVQQR